MRPKRLRSRFYCDENFPVYAGEFLKSKGYAVEYSFIKHPGLDDVPQLLQAVKQQAIFLTVDKDFKAPDFPNRRIKESAGIVIFHTDDPKKQYKRMINKFLKILEKNRLDGKLCHVSIDLVTIKDVVE